MSAPVKLVTLGLGSKARPEPPVRADALLEPGDRAMLRLTRTIDRFVPEALNPLAQTGAIANTSLIVAIVTGILLLFWYTPSVHGAWASVQAMEAAPFTAGLVRSLHRYSSDACLLFVLIHAAQIIFARRFTGARWLAWVTGILLVGLLWFVGWLGYWLVWDQRAQLVAVGTAKLMDGIPIFADPLSRSFLADAHVNSLLFFMVFFFHMLVPLAMGIALWLHVTRLSRPRYLTKRPMTLWVVGSLILLSLVVPATAAPAAQMTVVPADMTLDAWFLLPILATERLAGGVLWAIVLVGGIVVFGATRWMSRGRAVVAQVDASKCNACNQCVEDCPYSAITLEPRSDGRPYAGVAVVDASKCVGCGVCAGSCDSSAIGLPSLVTLAVRREIDAFVEGETAQGEKPFLAFVCASSAGADLRIDAQGNSPDLPGYRVQSVPCSGWVHALTIERALRRGAGGVLVVGCGPGEVNFREGAKWTEHRLESKREPMLRTTHADPAKVLFTRLDRTRLRDFQAQAKAFRDAGTKPARKVLAKAPSVVSGVGIAAVFAALVALGANVPRPSPGALPPQLVVSFKHPGSAGENCRTLSEDEKLALPPHMRQDVVCERGRAEVRLRVAVDGAVVLDKAYAPHGLSSDGNSVAIETLDLAQGPRRVELRIGETSNPDEWTYETIRTLDFEPARRHVALFDKVTGFTWHGGHPSSSD